MPWQSTPRNPVYSTPAWRQASAACLRRASYRCEIRGPRCAGRATQADHVDGVASDPHHTRLQAACKPCHQYKTAAESQRNRRSKPADPQPRQRTAW